MNEQHNLHQTTQLAVDNMKTTSNLQLLQSQKPTNTTETTMNKINFLQPSTKLEQIESCLLSPSLEKYSIQSATVTAASQQLNHICLSSTLLMNTSNNGNCINNNSSNSNINTNNIKELNAISQVSANASQQPNALLILETDNKILSIQRSISDKLRNSFKTNQLNKITTSIANKSIHNTSNSNYPVFLTRKWHSERYKNKKIQLNNLINFSTDHNSNSNASRNQNLTARSASMNNTIKLFKLSTQIPLNTQYKALLAQYTNKKSKNLPLGQQSTTSKVKQAKSLEIQSKFKTKCCENSDCDVNTNLNKLNSKFHPMTKLNDKFTRISLGKSNATAINTNQATNNKSTAKNSKINNKYALKSGLFHNSIKKNQMTVTKPSKDSKPFSNNKKMLSILNSKKKSSYIDYVDSSSSDDDNDSYLDENNNNNKNKYRQKGKKNHFMHMESDTDDDSDESDNELERKCNNDDDESDTTDNDDDLDDFNTTNKSKKVLMRSHSYSIGDRMNISMSNNKNIILNGNLVGTSSKMYCGLINANRYNAHLIGDMNNIELMIKDSGISNNESNEANVNNSELQEDFYERTTSQKHECQICFETVYLNQRNCCMFKACNECINNYIRMKIKNSCGVVKIECLNTKCTKLIHKDEICERMSHFDKNALKNYLKYLVDANKNSNCKTCPRCSHIMRLDDYKLLNSSSANNDKSVRKGKHANRLLTKVQCIECQLIWCFQCHAPWHDGITCNEFRKGDRMLKYWAKEVHFGQQNAQLCPKCKIYIQRTKGCDHMVCTYCQTEFCYKCGGKFRRIKFIGDHYSKLSVLGCKYRFYPEKPAKRKLIRSSVLGVKLLAAPVVAGIGVFVGVGAIAVGCVALPVYGSYKLINHFRMINNKNKSNNKSTIRLKNGTVLTDNNLFATYSIEENLFHRHKLDNNTNNTNSQAAFTSNSVNTNKTSNEVELKELNLIPREASQNQKLIHMINNDKYNDINLLLRV